MRRHPKAVIMVCLMLSSSLMGCFGDETNENEVILVIEEMELQAPAGELFFWSIDSNVEYNIKIDGPGFLIDEDGVVRDSDNWTYPAGFDSPGLFMHPLPGETATLNISAGELSESVNVTITDAAGIVNGASAFDTIDW